MPSKWAREVVGQGVFCHQRDQQERRQGKGGRGVLGASSVRCHRLCQRGRGAEELTQQQGIVLATGGGAILREANRRHLAARGIVVHLDSSIEKLIARTRRDTKRPLLQSPNPARTLRELKRKRDPLYAEIADYRVMTDHRGAGVVTRKILKVLDKEH